MEIDNSSEIYAPLPLEEPNDDDMQNSEERPNKRRRKKSIVWEHFTIESAGPSRMKACCKHCKKSFAYINGPKLAGTSHLKRHISLGICSGGLPKSEATPNTSGTKSDAPKRRYQRNNAAYAGIPFDQERCTRDIANMIIHHDYPLHIVEHPAFVDFVRTLHPQYSMVSFNTIQGECVALYLREKQSLLEHISEIPGRVNLTLDLATSNLSIGYAFLTGHFINSDWNLERRILNVIMLPFPDSDYAFNQAVISCISDWHLENKLFTITLDKSYSNETIMGNLRGLLPVKNSLLLNGQLLKGSCYARLLSQLVQDAMARVQEPIKRIRESVKYVKTSETHEEKFAELRQQLQVPSTKELVVDDLTKWNTTYQMLAAACELKEVFGCLDTADPVYKINPSVDDWKQVEVLCTFLKMFFDAASILTAPVYPPANAFYHEVSKIQLELSVAAMSHDPFVSTLTRSLKEKFDEYWRESFLVLAIAVVMDPRFKMKLVEFSFSKIFGENAGSWIKSVDDGIHELFLDYIAPPPANLMIQSNTHSSQLDPPEGVVLLPQIDVPSHGFSSLEDQSLQMHGHSHLSHSDAPHEVAFVPEIGGPSEEFSSHEGQSQGVLDEELQPEEKKPQELHSQDFLTQEVQHEAAYPEETLSQGVLSIEAPRQDVHSESLPQEMHTQEVPPAEEMDTQEVPPAEEMDTQEVPPPEEMDTQEVPDLEMQAQVSFEENKPPEVPVEEMSKAVSSEELPQNASSQEKIQSREEQPSQKVHAQELVPEEMQPQELPSQESEPREAPVSEDTHMQDVTPIQETSTNGLPTQEVHMQGLPAEKMETEVVPAEDVDMQEVPAAEELHVQGAEANKLVAEEAPAEQSLAEEAPAQESVCQEAQSEELVSQETPAQESVLKSVHAPDSVTQDAPAKDSVPQETPAQDSSLEEPPAQDRVAVEAQAEDSVPEETPAQGSVPEEAPAQGSVPEEAPAQNSVPEEAPAQDSVPEEAAAQDSVPEEAAAQDSVPEEAAAQDSVPGEAGAQDSVPEEAAAQKLAPQETPAPSQEPSPVALAQEPAHQEAPVQEPVHQEAPVQEPAQEAPVQEPAPQEAPVQEPAPQEASVQEPAPQEASAHKQALQEAAAQDLAPEETAAQEPAPQEPSAQEPIPLEQPAEESVSQEEPAQESIPQEAKAQDLLPPEAPAQELLPPEARAQELLPEEEPAKQLPPQESAAEEMLLEGVPIQGMISHGVQTHEMLTQETQTQEDQNMAQDMQHHVLPLAIQNPQVQPQDLLVVSGGNGFSDFEVYISAIANNQHLKSELDQYLEESLLPRVHEFDVLGWWKLNKLKYPTLSRLAADVLSIPVSTVGPESVFDTASKKIDSYHGSLHPLTLEAIICAKDWLQNGSFSPSSQAEVPNAVMKLEY